MHHIIYLNINLLLRPHTHTLSVCCNQRFFVLCCGDFFLKRPPKVWDKTSVSLALMLQRAEDLLEGR